jgi:hypothetical protein
VWPCRTPVARQTNRRRQRGIGGGEQGNRLIAIGCRVPESVEYLMGWGPTSFVGPGAVAPPQAGPGWAKQSIVSGDKYKKVCTQNPSGFFAMILLQIMTVLFLYI